MAPLPGRARERRAGVSVLADAAMQWKPVKIYALYSGGHDSLASTHYAMENGAHEVLHVNTGVGIEMTREIVRDNCRKFGWPLREEIPPQLTYLEMCAKFGVPGPGAHIYPYVWLKERAFDKVVRETKKKRMDRVFMVTGVRQNESARRMGYVEPVYKDGCSIWIAPRFDWTDQQVSDYVDDRNLPRNPVKDILGMSGECLCGAYGDRERELPIVEQLDPKCHALILKAESVAKANGKPCVWGRARKPRKPRKSSQYKLKFMPACVGCLTDIEKAAARR